MSSFIVFSIDIATAVGYLSVSQPFLDLSNPRHANSTHSEIMVVSILEITVEYTRNYWRVYYRCILDITGEYYYLYTPGLLSKWSYASQNG